MSRGRGRGEWAEDLACRHLQGEGCELIVRNYRCRAGEIDLVMRLGDTVLFVEVRYRGRADFGTGAESVNARKRGRLLAAAQHYLQRVAGAEEPPCRFDVVSISPAEHGPRIEWIPDAFRA